MLPVTVTIRPMRMLIGTVSHTIWTRVTRIRSREEAERTGQAIGVPKTRKTIAVLNAERKIRLDAGKGSMRTRTVGDTGLGHTENKLVRS